MTIKSWVPRYIPVKAEIIDITQLSVYSGNDDYYHDCLNQYFIKTYKRGSIVSGYAVYVPRNALGRTKARVKSSDNVFYAQDFSFPESQDLLRSFALAESEANHRFYTGRFVIAMCMPQGDYWTGEGRSYNVSFNLNHEGNSYLFTWDDVKSSMQLPLADGSYLRIQSSTSSNGVQFSKFNSGRWVNTYSCVGMNSGFTKSSYITNIYKTNTSEIAGTAIYESKAWDVTSLKDRMPLSNFPSGPYATLSLGSTITRPNFEIEKTQRITANWFTTHTFKIDLTTLPAIW